MKAVQLKLLNHEYQVSISSGDSEIKPFKLQLLKWIGNKQRFSHEIINYFPKKFNTYYEPFVGSGAVLGTLSPKKAVASDALKPLIDIWQTLAKEPELLKKWYQERWKMVMSGDKKQGYERVKESYNNKPNGADLLFISRSCYGGVIRFRKSDGFISTPCGVHNPVSPDSFNNRVDVWHKRTKNTDFFHGDFEQIMKNTDKGDIVYCDPPYSETQSILYGAQSFSLSRLFISIEECKKRGVYVILSIDGTKKSGDLICNIPIPKGLFQNEIIVNCGRSMLKRFQMEGQTLENEVVKDRLLLTY
ncbi:DNA adenine methylase [Desulfonema limicola]|uniref:Site-specific DNA-methyltransferase (adenine-specific) n=1 Tax=Desulfonema limicola TaxID=45656 RepID=A0A975B529_9BACT|nr:Dam family site-specific DNA-(adenine-N6)-methyltransferase [Desulfonema limicola]QTA78894.1 DNA adenine methylase [Desulfonema limicola]